MEFGAMKIVNFMGYECVSLENENVQMLVSRSVGPRILSLKPAGGENMLAELPDFVTDCPGSGVYHFYGGHRLWHAPEEPSRTYLPDDVPVDIRPLENGLQVTQDVEARTGLQKSLDIKLHGGTKMVITHRLRNCGLWTVTSALWSITQFKPGGVAILPQAQNDTGVLPNRSLAFWPYTNPSEPNVRFEKRYIFVHAEMTQPFKVGFSNPRGWLAYWWNGILFVKRARYEKDTAYYDFGSSSECYCNDQFLELETLSPIAAIEPGAEAIHVEEWELFRAGACPRTEEDADCLIAQFGLE